MRFTERFYPRLSWAWTMAEPSATFSAPYAPVDQIIVANSTNGWVAGISRDQAIQVPAIKRSRDLLCSIATLPLAEYGPDRKPVRSVLLDQIDPNVTNLTTLTQTVDDLLFHGISWWRVTARGWNDFPVHARHIDKERVHLNPPAGAVSTSHLPSGADPTGVVWIDNEEVPGKDMIRFDSPNDPLLIAARSAIRRALKLEATAEMYADNPRPLDYFSVVPNPEREQPIDEDKGKKLLSGWRKSRKERATAIIPEWAEYHNVETPTPQDLQLVELQARAALDIANAMGLDPEDLGVSTTSRTYQNAVDRRKDRINDVLAPYMKAITERLSMHDVTRMGYYVDFALDDYLRADPKTRAEVAQIMKNIGAITVDEIRDNEGRPALTAAQKRELTPKTPELPAVPTPQEAQR